MTTPVDLAHAMAVAARELDATAGLDESVATIVRVARSCVRGVDHVGVIVVDRQGRLERVQATHLLVEELDQLQCDLGEGPTRDAVLAEETVRVDNLRHEQRWPRYVRGAVTRGVCAQLAVRLTGDGLTLGALTFYSLDPDAIGPETERAAVLFAAHAGLALGNARRLENLKTALASRKIIGLALGLLMERLDLDEDGAFAYLTRVSASSETKLRDVAATLVEAHHSRLREPGSDLESAPGTR